MKLLKKFVLAVSLVAAVLITGCAQTGRTSSEAGGAAAQQFSKLEPLGQYFSPPPAVSAAQSRIVLYRTAQSPLPGATSVFVDGRYHASLQAGAWSALCFKTGPVELGARQMQVGSPAKDLMDTISAITLMPGQTHYLRVQDNAARPVLEPVAQAQALQEIAGTREQMHTISRVAQACTTGTAPVPAAPVTERITLPADTLFAFDRSDAQAMTDAGVQSLDRWVQRIRSDFAQVDHLHIIGHADPLGSAEHNEQLSQQRAQTVREHLLAKGLGDLHITTEGRGAREPVVTRCPRVQTPASIACNLPNRRVVVVVTGQRR